MRKPCFDQFLWVQGAMKVPAGGYLAWELHSCSIDRLEVSCDVNTTGDFLNQDGCQSLGSQLLVNTQKVHFNHELLPMRREREREIKSEKKVIRFMRRKEEKRNQEKEFNLS
jgi:hypothetical protein